MDPFVGYTMPREITKGGATPRMRTAIPPSVAWFAADDTRGHEIRHGGESATLSILEKTMGKKVVYGVIVLGLALLLPGVKAGAVVAGHPVIEFTCVGNGPNYVDVTVTYKDGTTLEFSNACLAGQAAVRENKVAGKAYQDWPNNITKVVERIEVSIDAYNYTWQQVNTCHITSENQFVGPVTCQVDSTVLDNATFKLAFPY